VKGYELPSGEFVLINDDELAGPRPRVGPGSIDIEEFVDLADIDPIFYDSAYYLAPDKATVKPYRAASRRAMEAQPGRWAIARFVMRSKQYLRGDPSEGRPSCCSRRMVYADEVNAADEISELQERRTPSR